MDGTTDKSKTTATGTLQGVENVKYAMYTQQATKIGKKDNGQIMYAIAPAMTSESEDATVVMTAFGGALNTMANRDRLHIEVRTFTADDGTFIICAEYVPNEYANVKDGAVLCRVIEG